MWKDFFKKLENSINHNFWFFMATFFFYVAIFLLVISILIMFIKFEYNWWMVRMQLTLIVYITIFIYINKKD